MPLAKGTEVKQVVRVIEGVVTDVRYNADNGVFTYHVAYTNEAGEPAARWFNENEVEAV